METEFDLLAKGHGKKSNQRMKTYMILQYLLKYSDSEHIISAKELVEYLKESCCIHAERRSIYKDIEDINKAMIMERDCVDVFDAEDTLEDGYDEDKFILYDSHKKGYFVNERRYTLEDIRLLAECIYSARFLSKSKAETLIDVILDNVSEYQAEKIKHDAFLVDRVKTTNDNVFYNVATINEAMSKNIDGEPHTPSKISFKYQKYSIQDVKHQIERRKGERYIVSPYKLIINDGNYYLLAFDDRYQDMRTYRVDRIKDVRELSIPRDGEEIYKAIDIETYTQRVFSMFGGKQEKVTLRFINPLLDTVVDRFGTKDALYMKADDKHFKVITKVEISDQFFGWICGFKKKVKIIQPESVVNQFSEYLDAIKTMY